MKAQEVVAQQLSKTLPTDHVLILNMTLPRTNIPAPMILINPQGVRILIATPIRGVYRAQGEEWQTFNSRARTFRSVRPNLQESAQAIAQSLHSYLKRQDFPLPELEAILIFTNPRTHVDTIRPRVRIVLRDAIEHFAANLRQQPQIMDRDDIDGIVDALLNPPEPEPEPSEEAERTPLPEAKPDEVIAADPFQMEERGPSGRSATQFFGLTVAQLAVLGVLAFFNLVILLAFGVILITSGFFG